MRDDESIDAALRAIFAAGPVDRERAWERVVARGRTVQRLRRVVVACVGTLVLATIGLVAIALAADPGGEQVAVDAPRSTTTTTGSAATTTGGMTTTTSTTTTSPAAGGAPPPAPTEPPGPTPPLPPTTTADPCPSHEELLAFDAVVATVEFDRAEAREGETVGYTLTVSNPNSRPADFLLGMEGFEIDPHEAVVDSSPELFGYLPMSVPPTDWSFTRPCPRPFLAPGESFTSSGVVMLDPDRVLPGPTTFRLGRVLHGTAVGPVLEPGGTLTILPEETAGMEE